MGSALEASGGTRWALVPNEFLLSLLVCDSPGQVW